MILLPQPPSVLRLLECDIEPNCWSSFEVISTVIHLALVLSQVSITLDIGREAEVYNFVD